MTATAAPTLGRRVLRSSAITVVGFGATQVIRLGTNLILTRLLFPEAFGMMALVSVFLMAIVMLSDIGTGPAIMQSSRGDDPVFLDTAWTIQIVRGVVLWLVALAATPGLAWFYGEPDLNSFLPVAALALIVMGFFPTRLETANRHLQAGLVTLVEIGSQVISVCVAMALAWAFQSVWALVISGVVASIAQLMLLHLLLPGHRNRLGWEPAAAAELIHFGKWILLATLCGFAVGQADKVILGRHLDLGHFGLYNIAYSLASLPVMLGAVVMRRVLIPVYCNSPPLASPANAARVRRLREGALVALLGLSAVLAFGGGALVRLLYDARYQEAAGIVVLIAATQTPALVILTCDHAALAMGDSRRYFVLTLVRAVLVTAGLGIGLHLGGLVGAVVGQGVAQIVTYPALAWLVRPHGAWDPAVDARFMVAAALLAALALWTNQIDLALIPH
ncbi:oligosaccharide flippase family protein [Rubellimicrobium arenae]|uniref:oligosaccharide flippase family protein n=1 Tax=Rubellimicrobium arenae TaxID=2817372 RepID=UPI001B301354|nr:oligosaccharide flippase family protein [Rubellimicrobium arenae]